MSDTIDQIKASGAVAALARKIHEEIFQICHKDWDGICDGPHFVRLGAAVGRVDLRLTYIRELLEAIQQIERGHK